MIKSSKTLILLLFVSSIFTVTSQIPNCRREGNNECLECEEGFTRNPTTKDCHRCYDEQCSQCYSDRVGTCMKCKPFFILTNRRCGIACTSLNKCRVCIPDKGECLLCNRGCNLELGKCSCTARNVIIILSVILSLIVIGIVGYCLINTKLTEKFNIVEGVFGIPVSNGPVVFERGKNELIKIDEKDLLNEKPTIKKSEPLPNDINQGNNDSKETITNNNSIITNNIEKNNQITELHHSNKLVILDEKNINSSESLNKKLCDYCLVEPGVIQLKCGCYFCERHKHPNTLTNEKNKCPVCKSKI